MNNCIFCEEGANFSYAKSFLGDDWPFQNRVIYSDNCVFAIVGYGPQVCPYLLIIPYRHICSLAEMDEREKKSFLECLRFLSSSGVFSKSICFFEHGGSSEEGSSSVDHCHVHIIDNRFEFFDYPSFSDYRKIHKISELQVFSPAYYLVGKYNDGRIEMKVKRDDCHEHQYFRKVLAELLGEKQWNWKSNPRFDLMIKSMQLF